MPRFTVNGETYLSTQDVAAALDLSPSTLRSLLRRGVLEDVPKVTHVTRKQRGFTDEWLETAARTLDKNLLP